MSEATLGNNHTNGEWQPKIITLGPLYQWPPRPLAVIKWILGYPGFFFPWIAIFMLFPLVSWFYLTPDLAQMKTFEFDWIAIVFLRNLGILILVAGSCHFIFYKQKTQGNLYKYNKNWPGKSNRFLFGDQNYDNIFWSIISGCSIWTIYEVFTYWLFANEYIGFLNWNEEPIYFVLLYLAIHPVRHIHFYVAHRLLHWKPLYNLAHYLHHKNTNPGPWSGLSMHPIEHILYFTGVILHWFVLSHPLHAIWHLQHAAITAPFGHTEFEKTRIKGNTNIPGPGDYFHYLHHKYFECNYGTDEFPLDYLFGTFHDGTASSHQKMRKKKKEIHG